MERFALIDSLLASGEVIPFERILKVLRESLREPFLSESSVRRDFRYMKNELSTPLFYDKKKHGWKYSKPYKLPSESFSDDELLALHLIQKLLAQHESSDMLYKSFDLLLKKISPALTEDTSNKELTLFDESEDTPVIPTILD